MPKNVEDMSLEQLRRELRHARRYVVLARATAAEVHAVCGAYRVEEVAQRFADAIADLDVVEPHT